MYFGLTILWTKNVNVSLEQYYDILRYFLSLILFISIAIYLSIYKNNFFKKYVFWVSLSAILCAIISILVFYGSHEFPSDRISGFNYYLKYIVISAIYFGFIGLCSIHSAMNENIYLKKIYFIFATLIIMTFVLLSQSRGPLLAFIISFVTGLALEKKWKWIGLVFFMILVWLLLINFVDIGIHNYILRGSIPFRIAIWKSTLFQRISECLWFGEGYLTDIEIYSLKKMWSHPHNIFLFILLKSGILGLLLFLISLTFAFITAVRYFLKSKNWLYLAMLLFTILSVSSDNTRLLYKPVLSWFILWFSMAMCAALEIQMKKS
jgi:O-antigen ligase